MLLWIWQALFPISAILRYDAIGSPLAIVRFSLHHALSVCHIRIFERGIILRSVLLERHIDRNLTVWKLEVMQIPGGDLHRSLQAHLNTELNAPFAIGFTAEPICTLERSLDTPH